MNSSEPIVSVCVLAFNHEPFISKALSSILNQKVNFKIEIVIGEDFSTDKTRLVCEKLLENNSMINLLPSEKNLGMIPNFLRTLGKCKGKYIAICEGDDYWTDERKLQRQIDFLEQHPEYSGCAHQANVIYEDQGKPSHYFNNITEEQDINTQDLIGLRKFHTASLVFRSEILKRKPYLPTYITSSDRALFLLLAAYGSIKFFPKTMCVYRKSNVGISNWVTPEMLKKDFNIIPWINKHNPDFPGKRYRAYVHKTVFQYPKKIDRITYIKHYLSFAFYSFSYFPSNLRELKSSWTGF